jgi:hypothetical protein
MKTFARPQHRIIAEALAAMSRAEERLWAAQTLQMSAGDADRAATSLVAQCGRLLPQSFDSALASQQPG